MLKKQGLSSKTIFAVLIISGILFMVIDKPFYDIDLGNLGFLFALTGIILFVVGSR
ncbi:MAG: hypothetical protein KAJ54_03350 [Candidatus Aenigmarchaeota archaeon]|nr:hypothetical protein [Candidatus Aenigmarchaeota archaeon]